MTFEPVQVGATIAAIGALGTAAFGLVDGLKTLPDGGISNAGFNQIERALKPFVGSGVRSGAEGEVKRLLDTLHGNWINGMPAADQKAIAAAAGGCSGPGQCGLEAGMVCRHAGDEGAPSLRA